MVSVKRTKKRKTKSGSTETTSSFVELKPGETEAEKGNLAGRVTNVTDPVKQRAAQNLARTSRGLPTLEEKELRDKASLLRTEKTIEDLQEKPEVARIEDKVIEEGGALPTSQEDIQAELQAQGIQTTLEIQQNDFLQRSQGLKPLDEMALYQQVLLNIAATGGTSLPSQFGFTAADATADAIAAGNLAQKAAQPGTKFAPVVGDAAKAYATNGKSIVKTAGWLLKSGFNLKTAPIILGAIGSYPFAGFIKEEALQTLSFGIKVAADSGDIEGEAQAIADMEEVLDSTGWSQILSKIPYANVLSSLNDFYDAARTKLANDKEAFASRSAGL